MLDFAIQHLEALKAILIAANPLGLAIMVLGWFVGRKNGLAGIRLASIGAAIICLACGSSDYRYRLQDIARARSLVEETNAAGTPRERAYAAHSLARANAALDDFSGFGLVFGLGFLLFSAAAIRPQSITKPASSVEAVA